MAGAPGPTSPSWNQAVRVWWAWTWRWAVWALGPLYVVSVIAAQILPPKAAMGLVGLVAWPWAIAVQVFVFKKILSMDFPGFRVTIAETP